MPSCHSWTINTLLNKSACLLCCINTVIEWALFFFTRSRSSHAGFVQHQQYESAWPTQRPIRQWIRVAQITSGWSSTWTRDRGRLAVATACYIQPDVSKLELAKTTHIDIKKIESLWVLHPQHKSIVHCMMSSNLTTSVIDSPVKPYHQWLYAPQQKWVAVEIFWKIRRNFFSEE